MKTKDYMKLQEGLSVGLKEMGIQKDLSIAIALMLKSEKQLLMMLDWIMKHSKENPSDNLVYQVAKAISQEVL